MWAQGLLEAGFLDSLSASMSGVTDWFVEETKTGQIYWIAGAVVVIFVLYRIVRNL
jgi:hypothetical protein